MSKEIDVGMYGVEFKWISNSCWLIVASRERREVRVFPPKPKSKIWRVIVPNNTDMMAEFKGIGARARAFSIAETFSNKSAF
jgi:hypothetical protein